MTLAEGDYFGHQTIVKILFRTLNSKTRNLCIDHPTIETILTFDLLEDLKVVFASMGNTW
jgi:hypothetical protein